MSKHGTAIIMIATAILAAPLQASAQRTAKGESFVSVLWSTPVSGAISNGVGVDYGRYGLSFYWKAGVSMQDYLYSGKLASSDDEGRLTLDDGTEGTFDYTHCTASADFMYRLAGTYSRRLNLYAGAGAFLGFCDYEMFHPLGEEDGAGCGLDAEFIYGIQPAVEFEVFLMRKAALTLGLKAPITPGTSFHATYGRGLVHFVGCAGIRVNF